MIQCKEHKITYYTTMKDAYPNYNHEETSGIPKFRNILQNNCPVILPNTKERLRNYPQQRLKVTCQLKIICDSELNYFAIKNVNRKTENLNGV